MKKRKNNVYVVPTIQVLQVELEQGIAAGSLLNAPEEPIINNWEPEIGGTQNQDL